MFRSVLLAFFILMALLPFDVDAQDLRLVYDGVAAGSAPVQPVNRSDEAILKSQLLPAARRIWKSRQQECTDGWQAGPEIRSAAVGSFTSPKANQRAVLYNYCTPAHAYAFNGLAIIEGGRVIVHYAYQSDWQHDIAAAPDLNNNGLSEIILVSGTTNQGTTWSAITLIELSNNGVQKIGFTDVFSDNCGNDERTGEGETKKLFAKAGAVPEFSRDMYKRRCNQKQWRRIKRLEPVGLTEDPTDYKSVK